MIESSVNHPSDMSAPSLETGEVINGAHRFIVEFVDGAEAGCDGTHGHLQGVLAFAYSLECVFALVAGKAGEELGVVGKRQRIAVAGPAVGEYV
jgi:hypothetical protein